MHTAPQVSPPRPMVYFVSVHRAVPGGTPGEVWRVDLRAGTACRLNDLAVFPLDFAAMADALASGACTLSRRPPLRGLPASHCPKVA